ncbi:hypothetical protein FRC20_008606, partial [Serendipita sp. 405]
VKMGLLLSKSMSPNQKRLPLLSQSLKGSLVHPSASSSTIVRAIQRYITRLLTKTLFCCPLAGAFSALPEKEEPFSLPYDKFVSDVTVGGTGAYFALQETISSFKKLPAETPKVFIATSNLLGVTPPVVNYMSLGLQKHTLAYLVQIGNKGYPDKGYRFYLATQVGEDGGHPGPEMSGEAHAIAYSNLIQRKERGGWDIRFIKDGSILTEN